MTTIEKTKHWEFVIRFRGGHKVWRWTGNGPMQGAIAIADDSGRTPDETDDGQIMWVDYSRAVTYYENSDGGTSAVIPVTGGNDGRSYTSPAPSIEGDWFADHIRTKVSR